MGELAAMDRARSTWTKLYYAPLVFSRDKEIIKWPHSIDAKNRIIVLRMTITDTGVCIALLRGGEKEPRIAEVHPWEFDDKYGRGYPSNPFTEIAWFNFRQELCTEHGLWDRLCWDFFRMCREGTLTAVARPRSPLEEFRIIAPEVFEDFEDFKIESWRKGVVGVADGECMYSFHAYRPTGVQELQPPQQERSRKQYSRPVRERLETLFDSEFPTGVPSKRELSPKLLVGRIEAASDRQCDETGRPRIKCDRRSILRIADDRRK
jgi:hypothetical protein